MALAEPIEINLEPYEVKPAGEGWDVKLQGGGHIKRCPTKREALQHATTLMMREDRPGILVYRGDGELQRVENNLDFWRSGKLVTASE